jgi:hypothetical protein
VLTAHADAFAAGRFVERLHAIVREERAHLHPAAGDARPEPVPTERRPR